MRSKHRLSGIFLCTLSILLFGCSGGSSGDKEKVYGTAVDPAAYFSPTNPSSSTKSKAVQLAECMTANGAVVYGSRGCSITRKQLALFEEGAPHLEYVDCNDHRDQCSKNRIDYYPTWICNRERLEGSYHLDFLARFAGCD
jgi:hypothetical protein